MKPSVPGLQCRCSTVPPLLCSPETVLHIEPILCGLGNTTAVTTSQFRYFNFAAVKKGERNVICFIEDPISINQSIYFKCASVRYIYNVLDWVASQYYSFTICLSVHM